MMTAKFYRVVSIYWLIEILPKDLHFTEEKTEAQRGRATCLCLPTNQREGQDYNPAIQILEAMLWTAFVYWPVNNSVTQCPLKKKTGIRTSSSIKGCRDATGGCKESIWLSARCIERARMHLPLLEFLGVQWRDMQTAPQYLTIESD